MTQVELDTIQFAYDPGQFVFDYCNEQQLAGVAASLGIDIATSRSYSKNVSGQLGGKATIKIFEVSGERTSASTESTTAQGTPYSAVLLQLLSRLDSRKTVQSFELGDSWEDASRGLEIAVGQGCWLILSGEYLVDHDRLLLSWSPDEGHGVDAFIPATLEDLTPTGRVRLTNFPKIKADVFAQINSWSDGMARLSVIAHAVFARIGGDPRFSWSLARHNTGSSGAGSDWD